jgi:hypothetical protein
MADLVNLNRARKKKRAAEKEKSAAANRAKFGRSKAEKTKQSAESRLRNRALDGHKRGGDENPN